MLSAPASSHRLQNGAPCYRPAIHQADTLLRLQTTEMPFVVQEPDSIVCGSKRFQNLTPNCGTVQGNRLITLYTQACLHCVLVHPAAFSAPIANPHHQKMAQVLQYFMKMLL